jgi:hypothetical protein
VPAQQQPDVFETVPRHNGLTRPSGQWHANWGIPASSVVTAVNQIELIQAILATKAIVFPFFHSIIRFSANLDNPNQRKRPGGPFLAADKPVP